MKIENVRVLNNYKVKLTNVRLAGVNSISHTISEQGTRFPIIITPPVEPPTFAERYERVFNYLIARYEPGWTAATVELGKAATMSLMGVSDGINPLILGNATEDLYNVTTGNSDVGYFNTLTHPKLFAAAVQSAYGKFERARVSEKANHRFIDYNQNSIYCQNNFLNGGNAFFGLHPNFKWFPDTDRSVSNLSMGLSANYDNKIHRIWMIAPYGHFGSPMNEMVNGAWRRLPWLNDHYVGENWRFDAYLIMRESTTTRDLLNDVTTIRSLTGGIIQGGTTDTYLNTSYRGLSFPAGHVSKAFNDENRVFGGYDGNAVAVGSPWIPFPNGISLPNGWWSANAGICFSQQTLILFDGSTFPNAPPSSYDSALFVPDGSQNDVVGICWAYGEELIASLDALADAWGNSMEFTGLLGDLPYGPSLEFPVPIVLHKDPTVAENVRYVKWRLDAAVSQWKSKFKSPIDGFAHVFATAASIVERTFHKWNGVTFNQFTNEVAGTSFIENIPVAWARDQYNYTHGPSSDAEMGVVLGIESFAQYMFKDDRWIVNPQLSSQQRYNGDPNPRHWCLDDDKAANLYTAPDHMTLGQRKWGITYSNSIWGMGICGTSTLGEIDTICNPANIGSSDSIMSGYPFMYNTFAHVVNGHLTWKTIPNTSFNGTTEGIPWKYDRRFRLFHLYPTLLALNTTIVDFFHCSNGYNFESGWFDKDLGNNFSSHWQTSSNPTTPARNNWTGIARTSEFELLYACMKGGLTAGLDSLGFTELHDELFAGLVDNPDSSREGFYRSLDFAVWGCSYSPTDSDAPSVVPLIRSEGNNTIYRGFVDPGSTAGMPLTQFTDYTTLASQIPFERRVFLPQYWLTDGPAGLRNGDYFFKQTADGTTYVGGLPGFTYLSVEYGGTYINLDTAPLRFATPWGQVNRSLATESFTKFLQQTKEAGILFSTVQDDTETALPFALGSNYNTQTPGSQSSLDNTVNTITWIEAPDARRTSAIVQDVRFTGITNSITNRTMAQDFKFYYDANLENQGLGLCGASAAAILGTYYTNITDRLDFKAPWAGSLENLLQSYAWSSTIYNFGYGELKSKIIGGVMDVTAGYNTSKKYSSDIYAMNTTEARYATDQYGHRTTQEFIPNYGHEPYFYGQISSQLISNYGYPPGVTTTEHIRYGKEYGWHPVSEGGITFGCPAYQVTLLNIKRLRAILRTRPQAYTDGIRGWVLAGISGSFEGFSGDAPATQYYAGNCYAREYMLENMYHLCLNGVEALHCFNSNNSVDLFNEGLVEWKEASGNTRGLPCTNATATVGSTVDRIDLFEVGTNMLVSGAMTTNSLTRLWRMTVPHNKTLLTKTSVTQPDLPTTINIPANSRGVWLTAPFEYGIPGYISS